MKNKVMLFALVVLCISCSNVDHSQKEDDYSVYNISNVAEHLTDTLSFQADNKSISSIELQISGYVKGNAIIAFDNGAGRFEEIFLTDSVKYFYKTEWYDNTLCFVYTPLDAVTKGNIILKYKCM